MNDNFTKMITEISEILGQMGQGNYRVEPTEEYVGDFVQIKDSMVKIIADMKKTLSTIQVSAQEIDGGSEQLHRQLPIWQKVVPHRPPRFPKHPR